MSPSSNIENFEVMYYYYILLNQYSFKQKKEKQNIAIAYANNEKDVISKI